jgi:hypothetical protein
MRCLNLVPHLLTCSVLSNRESKRQTPGATLAGALESTIPGWSSPVDSWHSSQSKWASSTSHRFSGRKKARAHCRPAFRHARRQVSPVAEIVGMMLETDDVTSP